MRSSVVPSRASARVGSAPDTSPAAPSWLADPELAAQVAHLADPSLCKAECRGFGGSRSRITEAYLAVTQRARPEDVVALLEHPSPMVRVYMVRHVVRDRPVPLATLYPRFRDGARSDRWDAGLYAQPTVAEETVFQLWQELEDPEVVDLLTRAALDPTLPMRVRRTALECTAAANRTEVRAVAIAFLDAPDADSRASALTALESVGTALDIDRIARAASDGAPFVRRMVARVLRRWKSPVATHALERLQHDPDEAVRAEAKELL